MNRVSNSEPHPGVCGSPPLTLKQWPLAPLPKLMNKTARDRKDFKEFGVPFGCDQTLASLSGLPDVFRAGKRLIPPRKKERRSRDDTEDECTCAGN